MNITKDQTDTQSESELLPEGKDSEIHDIISEIRDNLTTVGSHSEDGFLSLGNAMEKAHTHGLSSDKKINDILELAQGQQGQGVLADIKKNIRTSLEGLKKRRKDISSRSQAVRDTLANLKKLQSKNSDIERLAKYLRAVALNIFIETSRSDLLSLNFSIIATEIKELSETILKLSKHVREILQESETRFYSIYKDITQGVDQLDGLTKDAEKSLSESLSMTDDWVERVGNLAAHSAGLSKTILDEEGKIVMSLQFHDAMRQRVEHIESGLDEMSALKFSGNTDAETQRESLAVGFALSELFSDQLERIICEINEVHDNIENGFKTIGNLMSQIKNNVGQLTGATNGNGGHTMNHSLIRPLSDYVNLRERGRELVGFMDEAYTMVSQTSASLTEQVGQIHQISMDAHIKSLNAIIAATHLGGEGKTLAVLAEEMKTLSGMTDTFVNDVGIILKNMLVESSDTDTSASEGDEAGRALEMDVHTLSETMDRIKSSSEDMDRILDKVNDLHSRVIETITFIPEMVKHFKNQKSLLDSLKNTLSPFKGDGSLVSKLNERIEKMYTMETERQVHQKSMGGDMDINVVHDVTEDDNIELF